MTVFSKMRWIITHFEIMLIFVSYEVFKIISIKLKNGKSLTNFVCLTLSSKAK